MVDLNGNGLSDVWEWFYSAYNINPAADADGDGANNGQEAVAGTNPYNSNSLPILGSISYAASNVSISLPAALGKQYQLWASPTIDGTNWTIVTNVINRTGTNLVLTAATSGLSQFYSVSISDVDTDGDGLNDWEEYQLGLDPLNPFSNLKQDGNGNAIGDFAYATNMLTGQNVVTLTATIPTTIQPNPGQAATGPGQFTVTRGGFALNSITVNLGVGATGLGFAAPGVDYSNLTATVTLPAGVSSQTVSLTPLANTNLYAPALAQWQVLAGSGYTVGSPAVASIVISPSITPMGGGLLGQYYTNSSATYTNKLNFNPTNMVTNRIDPTVDFTWTNGVTPLLSNGNYSVRWTGQVQPLYSETYVFDVKSADGCKLWVNDQLIIDKWQSQNVTDWTNTIPLLAGVRYDIKLEYLQILGAAQTHLSWYSPSQSEVAIPSNSLYASNNFGTGSSNGVAVITSAMTALGFLGQPFNFAVTAANTPLAITANNVPPGLIFTASNGIISGIPTKTGTFQTLLTASNAIGVGASLVTITVVDTGSSVVQEIWTNVPGTNITDIPTSTAANLTNALGTLEGTTDYGDNYAERVRGYFTAPATGNYYFWIAGSDSAQLWISDDSDPVNKVLRASSSNTSSRQWTNSPAQQSGWLSLVGGQRYYMEILHKAGVGTGDNWSVAWRQDPTGTNTVPDTIVPAYLLGRYYPPLAASVPGVLYTANILASTGVASDAVGSATLRVSADGTQAVLNYQISNLTNTITGQAIDSDPYLTAPSELIYDISASHPQSDGSYLWKIHATGPLAAADINELINEGKAYINIETTKFPAGELSGHFTLSSGSQTFTAPPAPPTWVDDSANANAASRFLAQATFGASTNDIASVQAMGYAAWISNQFALPVTHHMPYVLTNASSDPTILYPSALTFNSWWQQSITAPDQLRQRVAFALSEIFVISENGTLQNRATALSSYYDMLLDGAYGNYRTLLKNVTLHPAMGLYLSMLGNAAGSMITGLHANENYAREIQQLFSVGLNRLWPDGTLILNAGDNLVPTYGQNEIMGFASIFTGWTYWQPYQTNGRLPTSFYPAANYTNLMVLVPNYHEKGTKLVLDNVMLPAAAGAQTNNTLTNYDQYGLTEMDEAINSIFNNQNVGPFICRQLIQRLVTSSPSRNYVYRVTQVFNNDGTGTRGNLQAVVSAILLDYEARSPAMITDPGYGKQREPLVRATQLARAFPAPADISGTYSQTTNNVITITNPVPHLLNSGDVVFLTFTDTSGNSVPTAQGYSVTVLNPYSFTVSSPQITAGTYGQTNGELYVKVSNHLLSVGDQFYLQITTGGGSSGIYTVDSVPDSSDVTAPTTNALQTAGACLLPRVAAGGYTQTGTNILISTTGPHGLFVGENVYLDYHRGSAVRGVYSVYSIPDPAHFVVVTTNSTNQNQESVDVYPLNAPAFARSGTVDLRYETWSISYTDAGGSASLYQTPLRSPTVFNFFYPGYEFPGALTSAGLTTPEFQLSTDSSVAAQINFIEASLLGNTGNTNGLSSLISGNGSVAINLGPYMTPALTTNTGIPTLISNINTLLMAGQLSAAAQSKIVSFVASTNFGYSNPPTYTQMRDRVRAVVHLMVNSPDYIIQK